MGTRYKTLENGKRQVINFLFSGDFIGLQTAIMGEMKHSVAATTNMVLCVFNRADRWSMFKAHPDRACDLTGIAAVEQHFPGETIATLCRHDAGQPIAWACLRMYDRLRAVGLGSANAVPLLFRQQDLADALGLSPVDTIKTIARLRDLGLATWTDGGLAIPDRSSLAEFAGIAPEPMERRPLM
jgi:CRP/FNR family transcriptional regulator